MKDVEQREGERESARTIKENWLRELVTKWHMQLNDRQSEGSSDDFYAFSRGRQNLRHVGGRSETTLGENSTGETSMVVLIIVNCRLARRAA